MSPKSPQEIVSTQVTDRQQASIPTNESLRKAVFLRDDAVPLNEKLRLTSRFAQIAEEQILPSDLFEVGYKKDVKRSISSNLIANLLYCHQNGDRLRVSCNASNVPNYRIKRQVLKILGKLKLVSSRKGFYDHDNRFGSETRLWPSPGLLEMFAPLLKSEIAVFEQGTEPIVLKNEQKEVISIPDNLPAGTLAYLQDRREWIHMINAVNSKHQFRYLVKGLKKKGSNHQTFGFTLPTLKAVYNNSRFDHGGRLYGDFQNIRKCERETLTIDVKRAVELDYSCLHPSILYHLEGLAAPEDAYALSDSDDALVRKASKIAFNSLINAKTRKSAILACNARRSPRTNGGKLKSLAKQKSAVRLDNGMKARNLRFRDIIAQLEVKHAPIAKRFGSGVGVELQNIDVELVYAVCEHFCNKGIPILPIHDSFLIQEEYKSELQQKMQEVFHSRFGFNPRISDK